MGRPGLTKNRKFPRLTRLLEEAHVKNAELVARGALELMWEAAYESGDDYLGDVADVEAAAHWKGKRGVLAASLAASGGEGEAGFIEEIPERPSHYRVHDLYDHAPEYVRKRMDREAARRAAGTTLSETRAEAARQRWGRGKQTGATGEQAADGCMPLAAVCPANGTPPAPTPSPAPAPNPIQAVPYNLRPSLASDGRAEAKP